MDHDLVPAEPGGHTPPTAFLSSQPDPPRRISFGETTSQDEISVGRGLAICATFVLIVLGIFGIANGISTLLAEGPQHQPILLYAAGSMAIVLLVTVVLPSRLVRPGALVHATKSGIVAIAMVALGLAALAGYLAFGRTIGESTNDVTILWLSAVAMVVFISLAGRFHTQSLGTAIRSRIDAWSKPIVIATSLVIGLVGVTRFVNRERFPSASFHDEWFFILYARGFREGVLPNPYRTHDVIVQSDVWSWVDGLVSRPFVDDPSSYRLLGGIVGTLAVITTMLLARRTLGTPVAIAGGLIIATMPAQLWASRTAMANILDPLVLTAALWLVDRTLATRDRRDALACGIVLGVGYYGYFGARAFPFVIALCMARMLISRPFTRAVIDFVRLGLWMTLGFVVTAAPMLAYGMSNPDEFFGRVNTVTDGVDLNSPTWGDRLNMLLHGLAYPLTVPNGLSIHAVSTKVNMLGSVASIFFGIGVCSWIVAIALRLARRPSASLPGRPGILLTAWIVLVIPISQTMGMESHRFLAITPLWALATASGILLVAQGVQRLLRTDLVAVPIAVVLVLAIAVQNTSYFFNEDRQYDMWGDPSSTLAYDMGWRFHTAPIETQIYGAGWPGIEFTWAGASLYWAPGRVEHYTNLDEFSTTVPPFGAPALSTGQVLLLGPGRFEEACIVLNANPHAKIGSAYDRYGGLLYMAFTNDPEFPFRTGETPAESTFESVAAPGCS